VKLQQLRFLAAVAQSDLNLTAAASKLGATQPAVSKQLKLLEDELGFDIFVRKGRALKRITRAGEKVVTHALRMLHEVQGIKEISNDVRDAEIGSLSIGTTHVQARYVLPRIVSAFRVRHPQVKLHLHQGTSEQIAELAALDRIDLAIDSATHDAFARYHFLPCHRWRLCVVVPHGHPLVRVEQLSLEALAGFPLITYEFGSAGSPASLHGVFTAAGLQPNVALTAWDSDVIKGYVRIGLGVGVISEVAIEPQSDADLICIDASHLLPLNTTWVGFARGTVMRRFVYDFLALLAPHLTRGLVAQAAACVRQKDIDVLFAGTTVGSWSPEHLAVAASRQ
jgi:LysR family transcriptional regulator, cys regulon transcriptional activator